MTSLVIFLTKINRIRASTAAAPPPSINDRILDEQLTKLFHVTASEISNILRQMPAKQCQLDSAPTCLVKRASVTFWLLLLLHIVSAMHFPEPL